MSLANLGVSFALITLDDADDKVNGELKIKVSAFYHLRLVSKKSRHARGDVGCCVNTESGSRCCLHPCRRMILL